MRRILHPSTFSNEKEGISHQCFVFTCCSDNILLYLHAELTWLLVIAFHLMVCSLFGCSTEWKLHSLRGNHHIAICWKKLCACTKRNDTIKRYAVDSVTLNRCMSHRLSPSCSLYVRTPFTLTSLYTYHVEPDPTIEATAKFLFLGQQLLNSSGSKKRGPPDQVPCLPSKLSPHLISHHSCQWMMHA